MSAVKSGSSLRSLVLTPERIPTFSIPSGSPLLFLSPRPHRNSPDRTRLLSDHDDDSPGVGPPGTPLSPAASRRFLLRLPPPLPRIRRPRRAAAAAEAAAEAAAAAAAEAADTDVTTRAAMSLPHVRKVSAPYGFRAVLAASPGTRRRESLFHRNKPVTVTVTDQDPQDPQDQQDPPPPPPPPGHSPGRSRLCLRPVKVLGLQVLKELKRPAATRRTRPR